MSNTTKADATENGSLEPASGSEAGPKPLLPRKRLSQEDVPGYSLDQALRVVQAIADNYAYSPTRPMNVAQAMKMTPSSGGFRGITGAAVAYGLTKGASNAPEIALTTIGVRIVRPTEEGDDLAARREALLKPRVVGQFLRQYDGAGLPSDTIAMNVLQQMGVPSDRLAGVLELILEGAAAVGFLQENGSRKYVDLTANGTNKGVGVGGVEGEGEDAVAVRAVPPSAPASSLQPNVQLAPSPSVSIAPGVHINIEIHIAADATSSTVEDIFRNMRRYVLNPEPDLENV